MNKRIMENDGSIVDKYLSDKSSVRKVRPPGVLYVTDLTKPCLRCSYYGVVFEREFPLETQRIFESGRLIEDWWTEVLRKDPRHYVVDTQVAARFINDELEVHGRVDVLAQHKYGGLVAHEVKSAKTAHWLREPKVQHREQLQFYLSCLGLSWGQVDYLDKKVMLLGSDRGDPGESVDKSFRVERDDSVFAGLVKRAKVLMDSWYTGTPPPRNECWLCDYCLFREKCEANAGGETLESPQEALQVEL